ncbi:unnamed protein product, partial [Polarella glacialis]
VREGSSVDHKPWPDITFAAVPGRHSQKPFLDPFLPKSGGRCLEVFARNLRPNWTSWGNEPLLFQNQAFFVAAGSEPPADQGGQVAAEGKSRAAELLRVPWEVQSK